MPTDQILPGFREKFGNVSTWQFVERKSIPQVTIVPDLRTALIQGPTPLEEVDVPEELLEFERRNVGQVTPRVHLNMRYIKNPDKTLIEPLIMRHGWQFPSTWEHGGPNLRQLNIPGQRNTESLSEQMGRYHFFCPQDISLNCTEPLRSLKPSISEFKYLPSLKSIDCTSTISQTWMKSDIVHSHLENLKKCFEPGNRWNSIRKPR